MSLFRSSASFHVLLKLFFHQDFLLYFGQMRLLVSTTKFSKSMFFRNIEVKIFDFHNFVGGRGLIPRNFFLNSSFSTRLQSSADESWVVGGYEGADALYV